MNIFKCPGVKNAKTFLGLFSLFVVLSGLLFNAACSPAKQAKGNNFNITVENPRPSAISFDKNNIPVLSAPGKVFVSFTQDEPSSFVPIIQEFIGKNVNDFITLTPALRGNWLAGERELTFFPEKDWTPGQKYQAVINKKLLSEGTKLNSYSFTFETAPNKAYIDQLDIIPIPVDGKKSFQAHAKIKFDYAVEPAAVEKDIILTLDKKPLQPVFEYDQYKRFITLKYEPIYLSDKEQTLTLEVKLDKEKTSQDIKVKSSKDFFTVNKVEVRESKFGSGYDLGVDFSAPVDAKLAVKDNKIKAWLLPTANKYGKNWDTLDIKEAKAVLKDSNPVKLDAYKKDAAADTVYYIGLNDDSYSYRYLYVLLEPGLQSVSGFETRQQQEFIVRVTPYPKELKITGEGSIMPLSGERVLNFVTRGIDSVKVKVSRILPERVNHLVSQTSGDIKNPCFGSGRSYYYDDYDYDYDDYYDSGNCYRSDSFNENDISEIFRQEISLNAATNKINYSSLDLKEYFKEGNLGIFLVEASDKDADLSQKRLISITDIGILYKKDTEGTYTVFAISISSGKPLSGAKVELLGRNGITQLERATNGEGVAEFKNITGLSDERKPVAFIVSKSGDYAFIPIDRGERKINYSRFDVSGHKFSSYNNGGLDAYIFTDRGLYRPGDEINFAVIAKNRNWSSTAGLPMKVVVRDPRDKTVFEKQFSLTGEGFTDFTFQTAPAAPVGEYEIFTYSVEDSGRNNFISKINFKVEEFKEDKLKITTTIEGSDKKGWFPLEGLKAVVKLENLFGTPAQGNRIEAKLSLRPAKFWFKEFKDYSFSDVIRKNKSNISTETQDLKRMTTDSDGMAVYPLDLGDFARGTYTLTFFAEGFEEESGHSVNAASSRLVSPNRHIVGYKTTANLNYVNRNSKHTVNFIAINADLQEISLDNLKIALLNQQYVSVPVSTGGGHYRYQSVLQESEIKKEAFAIKKGGASYNLPTDNPGQYVLEITDDYNDVFMRLEFFVSGSANLGYELEKNAELTINLENESIDQGGTLSFNITAPYSGTGLITIEKDKVYAYKWFTVSTNSSAQKIEVPAELVGGAYLNVSFLRSVNSEEIFASPHSYGVAYFDIKPTKHQAVITLEAPALVKPGEELPISYKTSVPSRIVVYGVNEGILQVARYKKPNPLAFFFRRYALEVDTYQMWDLLLPDFRMIKEVYGIGGDYDAQTALLEAGLNPFARKTQKPVVFWSGIMDSSTAAKTYTYKVPDYFNGQLTLMAVAVSQSTAGTADKAVIVRAPIILSAGAPVVSAPGDTFDIGLRVSNNKEDSKDGKIKIDFSASKNITIIGPSSAEVNVPYRQEKTVYFKAKATDSLGNGELTFKAVHPSSGETAATTATLSIRPASAFRVTVDSGKNASKTFKIKDFEQRQTFQQFASGEIAVSANPLIIASGLGAMLEKFPHGCTEQITSQIFPTIVFHKGAGNIDAAKDAFKLVSDKLKTRQLRNGGFSLWDSGSYVSDYPTIYALHMLTDADEMGYNVSPEMKNRALSWAQDFVSSSPSSTWDAKNKAYAHYLLAKNGRVMTYYLSDLETYLNKADSSWQKNIEGAYIAAAYKLLQNSDKARSIIDKFEPSSGGYYYNDYDNTTVRNARYVYLVARHFPELMTQKKVKDIVDILIKNVEDKKFNTLNSAATILALYAYGEHVKSKDEQIEILADGRPLSLTKNKYGHTAAYFMPSDVREFEIKTPGKDGVSLYYIITQHGFDSGGVVPSSNGMTATRIYTKDESRRINGELVYDNDELSSGNLGDEITVKIRARREKGQREATNVAITDILPGGFTVVPGSLVSRSGNMDFFEIREDRVLVYGTVSTYGLEIIYKAKLTSSGEFKVPAISAYALYDNAINSTGAEGGFTVSPRD